MMEVNGFGFTYLATIILLSICLTLFGNEPISIRADEGPNNGNQGDTAKLTTFISKSVQATIPQDRRTLRNYASPLCATVVETNPEAQRPSKIISEDDDEYMLNPTLTDIWFVIEVCEKIQATRIEMGNYELFSSRPKDFTVYVSDVYPTSDWNIVGQFRARDTLSLQSYDLSQMGFVRYIRVELHSKYRDENYYCTISQVKIYGISIVDDYDLTNKADQAEIKPQNDTTPIPIDTTPTPIKTTPTPRPKRKTSSYRVYKNMMKEPYFCGLSRHQSALNASDHRTKNGSASQKDNRNDNVNQLQPFNPNQNRTIAPLKPSPLVELNNKCKLLEQNFANLERRLNETAWNCEKSTSYLNTNFLFSVIAYSSVYVFMMRLM